MFMLMIFTSCVNNNDMDSNDRVYPLGPMLTPELNTVFYSLKDFDTIFCNAIASSLNEKRYANFCVSPFEAAADISMFLNLVDESDQNELIELFVGKDVTLNELNDLMNRYVSDLPHSVPGSEVMLDNSYTYYGDIAPSPQELNRIIDDYKFDVVKSTVSGSGILQIISILNNVSFLEEWKEPFDVNLTSKRLFYNHGGSYSGVDFMQGTFYIDYLKLDEGEIIQLEYDNTPNKFIIFLPAVDYPETIYDFNLLNMTYKLHLDRGLSIVAMPKFEITNEIDICNALKNMGYEKLFEPSSIAEKTGVDCNKSFSIDIEQKLSLSINETGSKDEIITGTHSPAHPGVPGFVPAVINIDRPFLFRIEAYGINIMEGRVTSFAN